MKNEIRKKVLRGGKEEKELENNKPDPLSSLLFPHHKQFLELAYYVYVYINCYLHSNS